jgi:hypothetical protein
VSWSRSGYRYRHHEKERSTKRRQISSRIRPEQCSFSSVLPGGAEEHSRVTAATIGGAGREIDLPG